MSTIIADDALALQRLYYREKNAPDRVALTQPLGGVSVPLFPTLAPGTIRQILEHSESRLLFVGNFERWARMGRAVVWHQK